MHQSLVALSESALVHRDFVTDWNFSRQVCSTLARDRLGHTRAQALDAAAREFPPLG